MRGFLCVGPSVLLAALTDRGNPSLGRPGRECLSVRHFDEKKGDKES